MTNLVNTTAAKLSMALVAVAMVFSFSAPAQAQTIEELTQMINDLNATIAALSGGTTMSSSCDSIPAPLTIGAQNANVTALQNFLMGAGQSIPAGATGYFGGQTQAALAGWQALNGVAPAVGYYGPITKAAIDAACVPAEEEEHEHEEDEEGENEMGDVTLSGEASLDVMDNNGPEDDTIDEGTEDAELTEFEIEFTDGDASISRIDVQLLGDGESDTSSVEPWEAFDTLSLWVDGDKVAEEDANDEDDWLDEDDGTFRFSGLDIIGMEDEDIRVVLGGSIMNNLDSEELATWDVAMDAMRFFDADDVSTTENSGLDFGTDENFTIEEEGGDDELIVKTSSDDIDGTTLQVEDDSDSDWYDVFVFDLDTDDSTNDISLDNVYVTVAVSSSTYNAIVDDAELTIGGTTIDDVTVTGGGTATAVLNFDVDGDVEIEAGDRVEAELSLKFNALASGDEGTTVTGSVTSANANAINAEGADDLDNTSPDQLRGAATGDAHTLRTQGVDVSAGDLDAEVTVVDGNDDYATYSIEFDVTAFEQDVYIATDPATSITYTLEDGSSSSSVTGTRSVTLTSNGDDDGTSFEVTEGDTVTFTLEVTYTPGVTSTASRLQLETIVFGESTGSPTGQSYTASPDEDYRTDVVTIVN